MYSNLRFFFFFLINPQIKSENYDDKLSRCRRDDQKIDHNDITSVLHQMKQMKLAQILRERTAKPAAELVNFVRFESFTLMTINARSQSRLP